MAELRLYPGQQLFMQRAMSSRGAWVDPYVTNSIGHRHRRMHEGRPAAKVPWCKISREIYRKPGWDFSQDFDQEIAVPRCYRPEDPLLTFEIFPDPCVNKGAVCGRTRPIR